MDNKTIKSYMSSEHSGKNVKRETTNQPEATTTVPVPVFSWSKSDLQVLMSVCFGCSPSDYLQSGNDNKFTPQPSTYSGTYATTATTTTTTTSTTTTTTTTSPNPPNTQSAQWDGTVLSLYTHLHSLIPDSVSLTPPERVEFLDELLGEYEGSGFKKNELVYTSLIRTYSLLGPSENGLGRALAVLKIAEEDKGTRLKNRTYETVVEGYCEVGECGVVEGVWGRMSGGGLGLGEVEERAILKAAGVWGGGRWGQLGWRVLKGIMEDGRVRGEGVRRAAGFFLKVRQSEERSDKPKTPSKSTKIARSRTFVQDALLP